MKKESIIISMLVTFSLYGMQPNTEDKSNQKSPLRRVLTIQQLLNKDTQYDGQSGYIHKSGRMSSKQQVAATLAQKKMHESPHTSNTDM
jgi:hypothetical protein